MIGKTLYFSEPAHISIKNGLLIARFPEESITDELKERLNKENEIIFALSEVAYIILDNPRITLTQKVFEACMEENVAIVTCDANHIPTGLCLTLHSNVIQAERYLIQINVSESLKNNLWAQIVSQKILNQGKVLCAWYPIHDFNFFQKLADSVKAGDKSNREGTAANHYWARIFPDVNNFVRRREGIPPNNLLNYGYAILRAITARAIVATGLLPTLGLHHSNRYNPYCLADDLMEPYRPYVDNLVCEITHRYKNYDVLTKPIKAHLLQLSYIDTHFSAETCPLMNGVQKTVHSLYKCFEGESRKLYLPHIEI
jgi:CRISPR-associated protein Cas1